MSRTCYKSSKVDRKALVRQGMFPKDDSLFCSKRIDNYVPEKVRMRDTRARNEESSSEISIEL